MKHGWWMNRQALNQVVNGTLTALRSVGAHYHSRYVQV